MGEKNGPNKETKSTYLHDIEWKKFWQSAALGMITISGMLTTWMVNDFLHQFNELSGKVGAMTTSVSNLNTSMQLYIQRQDFQEKRLDIVEDKIKIIEFKSLGKH